MLHGLDKCWHRDFYLCFYFSINHSIRKLCMIPYWMVDELITCGQDLSRPLRSMQEAVMADQKLINKLELFSGDNR
jgi:hypothetical protein